MNFDAERSLALMAADDGDLLDAEQSLTALIERAEQGLGGEPPNADALYQVCRCLLDRANVRSWAVRPAEALGDLDRAEPLLDRLKQINRRTLRVGLLDTRARLRAAPFSPVYDANRTLRLPDGNRVLLSLGFGYEVVEGAFVDFGYTHFFIPDGTIDETNQTADQSRLIGSFENSADVFGLQLTYNWKDVPWRDLPF